MRKREMGGYPTVNKLVQLPTAAYVFGCEGDILQKAMDDGCNLNRDCTAAGLTSQPPEKYNAWTVKQQAPEPAIPMGEMAIKA
ncbi:hypothetical protein VTK56DRAFT_10195 [Thermocarpiscus australiensis]